MATNGMRRLGRVSITRCLSYAFGLESKSSIRWPAGELSVAKRLDSCRNFVRKWSQPVIFDNDLKTSHRSRAARESNFDDRLQNEVADRLVDRMNDCMRPFKNVLIVGGAGTIVAKKLLESEHKLESLTYADASPEHLNAFKEAVEQTQIPVPKLECLQVHEESLLTSVPEEKYDVAISCLGLHWINDLPSALMQIKRTLKPDALFIGAFFGGETLTEMRIACSIAEMEREGGVSPRVSPLAQVRDAGSLISATGYSLPVVDIDKIVIRYPSAMSVVNHLRALGESNANLNRRRSLSRDTALAAAAIYQAFSEEEGVSATFEILYMSGWTPHESQQKPMQRGTASMSLKDLKEISERKKG